MQACLAAAQNPKGKKAEEIEVIARASIAPEDGVVIRTTDPMVVLREKGNVGASRNLLLRAAAYDIFGHRTVMPLQQIKETEMEIRTRRMVRMPKKYGEGESSRMNPGSSSRIYANASVEAEYHMIAQNRRCKRKKRKEHQK